MLELKNVSKFYYNKGIIASGFSKVNLKLKMGEFVAITGESGSGKSTLLNVISGLDSYEEGEMYINGKETSHYSEKDFEDYRRKYIGNIFQNFNLINSYTVYQNIELVLMLNGAKKRQVKQKVLDLIKRVDLYNFRNTKVSKLSGGQKQRVAIARALAKETPIIIADEPTGNLDSEAAKSIIKLLSEISKDKLVIIVTHNYEQVEPYVTRKIKMHDGKILEDTEIKKIKSKTVDDKVEYKNITRFNKLRLAIRNTFNIKVKFLLLLFIFFFITVALMSEYGSFKAQEYLAETTGRNYFFSDLSDNRIIIKKSDKTPFTDEDYSKIEQISNIKNIAKNDLLLDMRKSLTDNNNFYIYGNILDIATFKGEVDEGRKPENENEIIIQGDKNDYYLSNMVDDLIKTGLYFSDNYTGVIDTSVKLQPAGIKYNEDNGINIYSDTKIYVNSNILEKIKIQTHEQYSKIKVLFENNYYNSEPYTNLFRIIANDNVPQGKAYVSSDLNGYTKNGYCINKPIDIYIENLYYQDSVSLKIAKTYTKKNIKSLLGIQEFDAYNGAIFINTQDYNNLFNKATYQSSVFVKDVENIKQTEAELNNLGFVTLIIKDTLQKEGFGEILRLLKTLITIGLAITLFFISYFIIKIILKSRNEYFAILRMLGANKKVSRKLLIIELLTVANLSYIIFIVLVVLNLQGIMNVKFILDILEYLKLADYIIIYALLIGMSYLISIKYAKKLFKDSAIKTFSEEV